MTASVSAPPRPTSQRWAYTVLLILIAVSLGVSTLPAPLYGLYMSEWGLAPVTTTVVFAAYAFAALTSVLIAGSLSDRYGRRPLLLTAATTLVLGLGVFMLAPSLSGGSAVAALIIARAMHGAAVGAVVVAGTAALLDLRPDLGARVGHLTSIVFNIGITIAILGSALLAQYGPAPLVTPYAVVAVVVTGLLVTLACLHETHGGRGTVALRVARPRVPAAIRSDFLFAALGAMASWSVLGVFLSLFPTYASTSTGIDNLVFGGAVIAASSAAAVVSQIAVASAPAATAAMIGDVGTGLALLISIPAMWSGQAWAVATASVLIGLTFGLAFGGSLRHLTRVVPADHRGEVMSAFYVLTYSSMAVPTIVAGWAATRWSIADVYAPFAATVALACLSAAAIGPRALRRAPSLVATGPT